MYNGVVQKNWIFFYKMQFFWNIYASKNPGKMYQMYFVSTKVLAQLFSTLITINVYCAANQHIRLISKVSCDTEDWSNDAENSALHHRNKLLLKTYYNRSYFKQHVWLSHDFVHAFILLFKYKDSKSFLYKALSVSSLSLHLMHFKQVNNSRYCRQQYI